MDARIRRAWKRHRRELSSSEDDGSEVEVGAEVLARYRGRWFRGTFEGAAGEEQQRWRVQCEVDEPGVKTFTDRVRRLGGSRRGHGREAPESRSRMGESDEEGRPAKRRWKLRRKRASSSGGQEGRSSNEGESDGGGAQEAVTSGGTSCSEGGGGRKRVRETSGSEVEERTRKRRERPRPEKRPREASSEGDESEERRKRRSTRELESSGEVVRDRG